MNLQVSNIATESGEVASVLAPTDSEIAKFGALDIADRFAWINQHYAGQVVASTSAGAQAAVMLHLIKKHAPNIPVVFIDTGYHFPETYQYLETLKEKLKLEIQVYSPAITAARQEAIYGKLWEGDKEALERYGLINKVEPMNRALKDLGATAWISGLRHIQSRGRGNLGFVMNQTRTTKLYPILDWTNEQIDTYYYLYGLPAHPLLEKGYVSIGDWHSTKPLEEGQSAEDTRFSGIKRECGLHEASNVADYQI
ncbi:MAG: phosphoadenylyl-sulfate reductase [Verrucomicrobia bacterium]|nr:phosphoadenylyl-sulfate reductase [Verrucomicrobiota bacterium]